LHHRIVTILGQLRQDLARHLDRDAVLAAARDVGHTWRDCTLDPAAILHWLLVQALHGNTALEHLALLAGRQFTASAFCQARARLPLEVLRAVLRRVVAALTPDDPEPGRWLGHRTFLVDGSAFSMPDTPELQAHFGQPGAQAPGCGFPVAKFPALFHAGTGLLIEALEAPPRTHDMAHVAGLHPRLRPGDVLLGGRGFCSFAHLALLAGRGLHAAFRIHQKQIVDFTPGRPHAAAGDKAAARGRPRSRWRQALGLEDQVVEWAKPAERPDWLSAEEFAALPATLAVRELRYRVGRAGFRTRAVTLVTTLLDAEVYPLEALAELYGRRWDVETDLRHLKQTMRMDVLRCTTVEGVLKELTAFALAYNLVRMVMLEASRRQGMAVERLSFVDALRWLAGATTGACGDLPRLVVNPDRPGRAEPRVVKRRPKQYSRMTKPRSELRKCLKEQEVAA